jgi:N-acetylmuramoyl-L-alanine amidase
MQIVYPAPHHQTAESSTFLMGNVPEGWQLTINDTSVPVTPKGRFAWKVPLMLGDNNLQVRAFHPETSDEERQTLPIYRQGPRPFSETIFAPLGDVTLMPGDFLELFCFTAPTAQVRWSAPGLLEEGVVLTADVPREDRPYADNREGIFAVLHQTHPPLPREGCHTASVLLPGSLPEIQNTPMQVQLATDGESPVVLPLEGRLSIRHTPWPVQVRTDRAILRTHPGNGARLTPQCKGTILQATGERDGWTRVRLGAQASGWMASEDLAPGGHLSCEQVFASPLRLIRTQAIAPHQSRIEIPLPEAVPLRISHTPHALRLLLSHTVSRCDFIHFHPEEAVIRDISWEQVESEVVAITVEVPGLSGYDYAYTETPDDYTLTLELKTLPSDPLACRILLDPGHGGAETGATSLSGIPEKDLNLSLARMTAELLGELGYTVSLTRTTDQDCSLEERARRVTESGADLLISLHHNALPDGRDPLKERGTSTYYYHPMARPLAEHLQQSLVQALDLPNYGLLYDNLFIPRVHQALSILVEVGFLTHPAEHDRITTPAFQQDASQALAQGIHHYCAGL